MLSQALPITLQNTHLNIFRELLLIIGKLFPILLLPLPILYPGKTFVGVVDDISFPAFLFRHAKFVVSFKRYCFTHLNQYIGTFIEHKPSFRIDCTTQFRYNEYRIKDRRASNDRKRQAGRTADEARVGEAGVL